MTPSEKLIMRKVAENAAEDYDRKVVIRRTANELGLRVDRVIEVWNRFKADAKD